MTPADRAAIGCCISAWGTASVIAASGNTEKLIVAMKAAELSTLALITGDPTLLERANEALAVGIAMEQVRKATEQANKKEEE